MASTARVPEQVRIILKDGRSLLLRVPTREDLEKMKSFLKGVSPKSRYFRFHSPREHFSDEEILRMIETSPPDSFTYVATTGTGDDERIVASASWFLTEDGAEVGFLVSDEIQALGVGTGLLEQLAVEAVKHGIRQFIAYVLPENRRMIEVFEKSGFRVKKVEREGILFVMINLVEKADFLRNQMLREHLARSAGVRRVLYPESVAVIGASRREGTVGNAVFKNLLGSNFNGPVFPVNPKAKSICGVYCYPSILDVPGEVDLAVVVVPAERVLEVVEQCAEKKVRGMVIISAGFGEAGPEGKEREEKLWRKLNSYGIRAVGPNCLGVMNTDPSVRLNATFSPYSPPSGKVSIGTQSGALGLALLDHAEGFNLGISHFVSIGNQTDITSNDLLEFWEDDENTDVILLYLESFGDPKRFGRIARRVSKKKPIIAVKSGRSEVGAKAASSHTGALAATDVAVDTMFKQAGVIRVDTLEEMFSVAEALAHQPLPRGNRVAVLTNAGGPGILVADACDGSGFSVPELSKELKKSLSSFLPAEASVKNPVDMIASATPEQYAKALDLLMKSDEVDAIIVIYIPVLVTKPEEIAEAVKNAVAAADSKKPVYASFMMSDTSAIDLSLPDGGAIPNFPFPESSVKALEKALWYAEYLSREEGTPVRFPEIDEEKARQFMKRTSEKEEGSFWLYPEEAAELFNLFGIRFPETLKARSPEEAVEVANRIGYPVVLKVRSKKIVHKTDVGGVIVGLEDEDSLVSAARRMKERIEEKFGSDALEGFILQPAVEKGLEMIAGVVQDPLFGPLVMVGLGGTQVELFKDVSFSLHPLTDKDAERTVRELKSHPMLTGWRGAPPADEEAVRELLLRLSAMVGILPEIEEVEINPVLVYEKGRGILCVDGRVHVKGKKFDR